MLLFEDLHFVAVYKPAGIAGHHLESSSAPSCESEINLNRLKKCIPAHRLDTGTSGILLFCKSSETHRDMRKIFNLRLIQKNYSAVSHIPIEQLNLIPLALQTPGKWHECSTPLANAQKNKMKMVVLNHPKKNYFRGTPLPALSHLNTLSIEKTKTTAQLNLEIRIETGVRHQIRAHCASLGLPLFGDSLYDGAPAERLFLHANRLNFHYRGFNYDFFCPPPWNTD